MNVWDILIGLLVAAAAAAALRHILRGRSKGCGGCCAECRNVSCGGRI